MRKADSISRGRSRLYRHNHVVRLVPKDGKKERRQGCGHASQMRLTFQYRGHKPGSFTALRDLVVLAFQFLNVVFTVHARIHRELPTKSRYPHGYTAASRVSTRGAWGLNRCV